MKHQGGIETREIGTIPIEILLCSMEPSVSAELPFLRHKHRNRIGEVNPSAFAVRTDA
jgi:hypothetical protein